MRVQTSSRSATVSVAMLRMGYAEVVFIQPGGKLDTIWRGAWQGLATRHQGEMWSLQQDGAPSHTARNTETGQTFCPLNSPDLNTVNLQFGVFFSSRSTIIKVSPSVDNMKRVVFQKHGRNYRMAQTLPIDHFLPARRYASAGYSDRNVSVSLSVCHAPVLCQNEES